MVKLWLRVSVLTMCSALNNADKRSVPAFGEPVNCSKCGILLAYTRQHFYPRVDNRREPFCYLQKVCKSCQKANATNWDKNNAEKRRATVRERYKKNPSISANNQLKQNYGITLEDYNELLKKQGYSCAICGRLENENHPFTKKPQRFSVDHDHITGKVRGLLCNRCNLTIGKFDDDVSLFQSAILYLEKSREVEP